MRSRFRVAALCAAAALVTTVAWQAPHTPGTFLYVWTGDSTMRTNDFLAVLDADPKSKTYGSVVTTVPVSAAGMPHHTEHAVAADDHLLADDFSVGRTFLFDLTDARQPKVVTSFDDRGGFSHPHSYFRLADGSVISTFQYAGKVAPTMMFHGAAATKHPSPYRQGGGLVVMDERGVVKRTGDAFQPQADSGIYPYSVLPLPKIDRTISTSTDMDEGDLLSKGKSVQIWRLSDLTLLRTFQLPRGPRALDVTDQAHPREVSRVTFDTTEHPHWVALDPTVGRPPSTAGGHLSPSAFTNTRSAVSPWSGASVSRVATNACPSGMTS